MQKIVVGLLTIAVIVAIVATALVAFSNNGLEAAGVLFSISLGIFVVAAMVSAVLYLPRLILTFAVIGFFIPLPVGFLLLV